MSENYPPTPDPNANQGGANPYSGAGSGYTPGSNNVPNLADPNFFKALFDFSFSQFITVKFASFIYAAALILVGLGYVGVVISALSQNILAGFGALIFGALVALLYVIFIRIGLEFSVAMIRTAQNTTKIAEKQD